MPVLLDARAGPDGASRPAAGPGRVGGERGEALTPSDGTLADAPGPGGGETAPDAPGPVGGETAPDAPGGEAAPDAPGPAGGVLVIGYGNALRSDDGVGVHAAGMLARDPRIAWADVRAVMQLTPELAADLAEASLVVLVDASVEGPPGSVAVQRLGGEATGTGAGTGGDGVGGGQRSSAGTGGTSHHVGAEGLAGLARELYGAAPDVVVVSVGVATLEAGEALSPAVAAALPEVADVVAALLAGRPGPAG